MTQYRQGKTITPNSEHARLTPDSLCRLLHIQGMSVTCCLTLLSLFPGFSLSSVEEDGVRRLYVNSVKETGLASKKGKLLTILSWLVCLQFPFGFLWLVNEKDQLQMFTSKEYLNVVSVKTLPGNTSIFSISSIVQGMLPSWILNLILSPFPWGWWKIPFESEGVVFPYHLGWNEGLGGLVGAAREDPFVFWCALLKADTDLQLSLQSSFMFWYCHSWGDLCRSWGPWGSGSRHLALRRELLSAIPACPSTRTATTVCLGYLWNPSTPSFFYWENLFILDFLFGFLR